MIYRQTIWLNRLTWRRLDTQIICINEITKMKHSENVTYNVVQWTPIYLCFTFRRINYWWIFIFIFLERNFK